MLDLNHVGFGERNFGQVDLGDKRRTKRLVQVVDQMAARPGGSLPEKVNQPHELKAMYRLLNCPQVTHETILAAHRQHLLQDILPNRDGYTLILHDSTELEYTKRYSLDGLGQIGNGYRKGYITHNSLMVCPDSGRTLGLVNQILHRRPQVDKNETQAQKKKRETRESLLWLKGTKVLPANRRLVDVCDRGADTLEFIDHEAQSGRTFLIRSSVNRICLSGHQEDQAGDQPVKLHDYAKTLPMAGTWNLEVTSKVEFKSKKRKGKKRKQKRIQRTAKMAVSFGKIQLKTSPRKNAERLELWVVRVWELDPPPGQERLEWFLITNHPVASFEDAYEVAGWYERRWIIEEYHKCLKTGMNIESYQFTSEDRLQPAIALTSVVATTLLTLRDDSRNPATQTRPAREYIDLEYIAVLSTWRHGEPRTDWTVHEFVLALARLSGHQNRKGDHPPGWQKLWKGWTELQAMMVGARIAKEMKKCG